MISNPRRSWGGVSTLSDLLARGLQQRGHEVRVFCRPGSPFEREMQGRVPTDPVLYGADLSPLALLRIRRALRRHGTQVVLSSTPKDLRLTAPAARLARIPVVVQIHETPRGAHRLQQRVFYGGMSDHLVAVSRAVQEEMLQRAPWLEPGSISCIHNAIDVEPFRAAAPADLGLPPGAVVVGFVGRLQPYKGVWDLVEAWSAVAEAAPDAHLVVAGPGAEETDLRSRLGALPRTHWLGFRRDVPAIMKALDLLVMPSWHEPFGLTAVEAMAAGRAVVATRAGGLAEVVEDGRSGLLVPPRDPRALAEAVLRLVRDPARRAELGRAGAERAAREFSLPRLIGEYEALLETFARGADRP